MFVISAKRPGDASARDALLDWAFGPDRHRKTAHRYRAGAAPVAGLELMARDPRPGGGAAIVGSIQYWPVVIGIDTPALLLGPLAVAPGRAGEGIGRTLVNRSLDMAQAQGHRLVLLVGPLKYYGELGFRAAAPHGITMPDEAPERLLVAELAPHALSGVSGELKPWRWVRRDRPGRLGTLRDRVAA